MEVSVEVTDPLGAGLADLARWLRREDVLRGRVRLVAQPPGPEEMGGVVDLLAVAVGSGGAATVLATALSQWLTTRRSNISVTVSAPGGRTVTVEAQHVADPLPLLREVLGAGDGE